MLYFNFLFIYLCKSMGKSALTLYYKKTSYKIYSSYQIRKINLSSLNNTQLSDTHLYHITRDKNLYLNDACELIFITSCGNALHFHLSSS